MYVYRPRTGETKLVIKGGDVPRFSVDGKQLAWVVGDVLYIGGPNGEQPRAIGSYATINHIEWSADGTRLLFQRSTNEGKNSEIWVVDAAAGTARKIADGSDPSWAPDSKRIAYVTLPADEPLRKTQLRLVNFQGDNGWAVVTDVPANAPPIGPPQAKRQPKQFEHVLSNPVWDESGKAIYVVSLLDHRSKAILACGSEPMRIMVAQALLTNCLMSSTSSRRQTTGWHCSSIAPHGATRTLDHKQSVVMPAAMVGSKLLRAFVTMLRHGHPIVRRLPIIIVRLSHLDHVTCNSDPLREHNLDPTCASSRCEWVATRTPARLGPQLLDACQPLRVLMLARAVYPVHGYGGIERHVFHLVHISCGKECM